MLRRVLFGFIGASAVISNILLVVLILKNKYMLKTPYNVLVLSLAATDMITGKRATKEGILIKKWGLDF